MTFDVKGSCCLKSPADHPAIKAHVTRIGDNQQGCGERVNGTFIST